MVSERKEADYDLKILARDRRSLHAVIMIRRREPAPADRRQASRRRSDLAQTPEPQFLVPERPSGGGVHDPDSRSTRRRPVRQRFAAGLEVRSRLLGQLPGILGCAWR